MTTQLKQYKDYILNQGLSIKTSENYISDIKTFETWLVPLIN